MTIEFFLSQYIELYTFSSSLVSFCSEPVICLRVVLLHNRKLRVTHHFNLSNSYRIENLCTCVCVCLCVLRSAHAFGFYLYRPKIKFPIFCFIHSRTSSTHWCVYCFSSYWCCYNFVLFKIRICCHCAMAYCLLPQFYALCQCQHWIKLFQLTQKRWANLHHSIAAAVATVIVHKCRAHYSK